MENTVPVLHTVRCNNLKVFMNIWTNLPLEWALRSPCQPVSQPASYHTSSLFRVSILWLWLVIFWAKKGILWRSTNVVSCNGRRISSWSNFEYLCVYTLKCHVICKLSTPRKVTYTTNSAFILNHKTMFDFVFKKVNWHKTLLFHSIALKCTIL